jgi:hypothetical protein
MYATLVQHCDVPVDTQHLMANKTLQQSYYHNYPQGLLGFLHDMENAYATLSHLGKEVSDRDKLNTLKVKLHTESTQFLTAMITQNMLTNLDYIFEDALQLFELHAEQVFNHNKTNRHSVHMVSAANMATQYPFACAYLSSQGKKPDYNVGDGLWALLDSHLRNQLITLPRDHINSKQTPVLSKGHTDVSFAQNAPLSSSPSLPAPSPSPLPSLPKQYSSRGNLVYNDLDEALEVTPDSVQAMMMNLTPDSTFQDILARMSIIGEDDGDTHVIRLSLSCPDEDCVDIKCHLNFIHSITAQLQHMGLDCHVSTSDSGADTCVFGNGWVVRNVISKG